MWTFEKQGIPGLEEMIDILRDLDADKKKLD